MSIGPFDTLTATQREFLVSAVHSELEFVVVGGYAVRAHGHLRRTSDLDVLVATHPENLSRLHVALTAMQSDRPERVIEHLSRGGNLQKVRWEDVELFSCMTDLDSTSVLTGSVTIPFGRVQVPVMSRDHLLLAKHIARKASNRGAKAKVDLEDLAALIVGAG